MRHRPGWAKRCGAGCGRRSPRQHTKVEVEVQKMLFGPDRNPLSFIRERVLISHFQRTLPFPPFSTRPISNTFSPNFVSRSATLSAKPGLTIRQ